jgi:acyl-CoA thioesterase II
MTDSALHGAQRFAASLDDLLTVSRTGLLRDTFVGEGRDYGPLGVYGGHLLGQGLAAAFATVSDDKPANSLHAYFVKSGQPGVPIGYRVERLRDGRHYATRSVQAVQDDRLLMVMMVSCKTPESGDEHQPLMPELAAPAALARRRKRTGRAALSLPFTGIGGVEMESGDGWSPQGAPGGRPAIVLWLRAALSAGADVRARQCALAYLSDSTMMFNALRPHGRAFASHRAASLDHAMWFHRDGDPGRWLLFDQQGPVAADGRGLNQGALFDADGRLLASVAQEALLRRL